MTIKEFEQLIAILELFDNSNRSVPKVDTTTEELTQTLFEELRIGITYTLMDLEATQRELEEAKKQLKEEER